MDDLVRWHLVRERVGRHPGDYWQNIPDGWTQRSKWEVITAFAIMDEGTSCDSWGIWKCEIEREEVSDG